MAKDRTLQAIQSAVESGTLKAGASQLLGSYEPLAGPLVNVTPEGAEQFMIINGAKNGQVTFIPNPKIVDDEVWMLEAVEEPADFVLPKTVENTAEGLYKALYTFQPYAEGTEMHVTVMVVVDGEEDQEIPSDVKISIKNKYGETDIKESYPERYEVQLTDTEIVAEISGNRYSVENFCIDGNGLGLEFDPILSKTNRCKIPFVIPLWDAERIKVNIKTN